MKSGMKLRSWSELKESGKNIYISNICMAKHNIQVMTKKKWVSRVLISMGCMDNRNIDTVWHRKLWIKS